MDFSTDQLRFIDAPFDKDTLVIAPPGSGKSMTTRARVGYMILNGVSPENILVTMFNKPAAEEFRANYKELNLPGAPKIRHYHSLAYRICDNFMKRGILPNWKLEDREFVWRKLATDALRKSVAEFGSTDINLFDNAVIEAFVGFIDYCKSDTVQSTSMFSRLGLSPHLSPFTLAFDIFEEMRAEKEIRSFNDLIYDLVKALLTVPRSQSLIANHLDYILIDEYQDINPVVQKLFTIMAGERAKTTAIGDDDQTIFEWRGSDPLIMSKVWDMNYPDSQKFTLTNTFRYGHALALAANNCIFNNSGRTDKMCLSAQNTPQTTIEIGYYAPASKDAEPYADSVQSDMISAIGKYVSEGHSYSDIAILPRLYSVTSFIELALFAAGIPYKLEGGKSICHQPIFIALESLASLCENPDHSNKGDLFYSVFTTPAPGVRSNQVDSVAQLFWSSDVVSLDEVASALPESKPFVQKRVFKKIEAIRKAMRSSSPTEAFRAYVADFLLDELASVQRKHRSTQSSLTTSLAQSFYGLAQKCSSFEELRQTLSVLKSDPGQVQSAISIMSMHMAKGMTVGMAIVPACCETVIPALLPGKVTDIDAERRLFYVAITRPKDRLLLLVPRDKAFDQSLALERCTTPEGHSEESHTASRFVYEMNIKGSTRVATQIHSDAGGTLEASSSAKNFNKYLSNLNLFLRVNNNA